MTLEGSVGSPTRGNQTGARDLSVENVSAADGDAVTMDGEIVTAWADSDVSGVAASVTAVNGDSATLQVTTISDGTAATATDVTVFAVTR